ncbi:hypothetical protein [Rasiella sp. SM2506]|uniref:hypothetical protein n=1 Tax=Rasiella sp. SM2506 TaxID=3423914 RepID=UPI003D7BDF4D
MGKFLKQLSLFFLLLFMVCLLVFGIQTWVIRSHSNFKFSKDYDYFMIGHSHPECAYNDSLIGNFKNIAASGEAYFYTYYKLKELLKDNDSVQTVMIEFTNNQIDSAMDKWIWGDKSISQFYTKYGSYVDFHDHVLLSKESFGSVINSFSVLQKRNFMRIIKNDYNYVGHIGGYVYYDKSSVEAAKVTQRTKRKNHPVHESNSINLLYLERIIALCKEKNKRIILVRTAQHASLKMRENEEKYLKVYYTKFSDLPLLDFNDFEIPDYGFKDLEHLNYKGAIMISKTMDSLIQNKVFDGYFSKIDKRIIITK